VQIFSLADSDMPLCGRQVRKKVPVLHGYPTPAGFPSPRATAGWLRGHVHFRGRG
jgi:hypothetical protein